MERDLGGPDGRGRLVDAAHRRGLALLVDMVFNHTSNHGNPLWELVLEQRRGRRRRPVLQRRHPLGEPGRHRAG